MKCLIGVWSLIGGLAALMFGFMMSLEVAKEIELPKFAEAHSVSEFTENFKQMSTIPSVVLSSESQALKNCMIAFGIGVPAFIFGIYVVRIPKYKNDTLSCLVNTFGVGFLIFLLSGWNLGSASNALGFMVGPTAFLTAAFSLMLVISETSPVDNN